MKEVIQGGDDEEFDDPKNSGSSSNDLTERNGDTVLHKENKSVTRDRSPNERVDIDLEKESSKERNEPDCSEKKINEKEDDDLSEIENSSSERGRRSSTRLQGKRPRIAMIINSSDEENFESSDEEMFKRKKRSSRKPTFTKPVPLSHEQSSTNSEESREKSSPKACKISKKANDLGNKPPKEFSSGSFVVLKTDYHSTTNPPIWKIDGKALLQKFVHFDQDGQILYRNTSTYSGWTVSNRDQYYPATVENKFQNRKETIVKFKKELIVADDSD